MTTPETVVLGTGILATILELLFGAIFIAYKKAVYPGL